MAAHGGVGVPGDSAACGEPGGGHAAHGGVGGPPAPPRSHGGTRFGAGLAPAGKSAGTPPYGSHTRSRSRARSSSASSSLIFDCSSRSRGVASPAAAANFRSCPSAAGMTTVGMAAPFGFGGAPLGVATTAGAFAGVAIFFASRAAIRRAASACSAAAAASVAAASAAAASAAAASAASASASAASASASSSAAAALRVRRGRCEEQGDGEERVRH